MYDTARRLGVCAGAFRQLSNGVFERLFAYGLIVVNPTANPVRRFWLGGGSYSGPGLAGCGGRDGPASGLILHTAG